MEKYLLQEVLDSLACIYVKDFLDDGYRVYGIDNLNDYYDVSLKEARLKILFDYSDFTFNKIDISNLNNVETVFEVFKPQKVVNLAAQAGIRYSLKKSSLIH